MDIVIEHLQRIVDNRQRALDVVKGKVELNAFIEKQIELDIFKKAISILKKSE